MIDDDFLPLDGYTPSVMSNSRSSSMRKISKKQQTKTVTTRPPEIKPSTRKDDFDDLLDQLIEKEEKKKDPIKPKQPASNQLQTTLDKYDLKDSSQSFYPNNKPFEKKSNEALADSKPSFKPNTSVNVSRPTFSLNDDFGATTLNFPEEPKKNQKKDDILEDDQPVVQSVRTMMKPPLRNRINQSTTELDSKPKQTLTINLDSRVEAKMEPKFELKDEPSRQNSFMPNFGEPPKLDMFETRMDPPKQRRNSMSSQKNLQSLNPMQSLHDSKPITIPKVVEVQPSFLLNPPTNKPPQPQSPQQSTPPQPSINLEQLKQQHRKQLQLVKQTYERQLKFLNEQMQKSLRQEKLNKQRIMNDLKEMMSRQKDRYEKIMKQEVQRVKEMTAWEKQKVETMYKSEIASLKNLLEQAARAQQNSVQNVSSFSSYDKRRVEQMEERLKGQMEALDIQRKKLQRIEVELQEKQSSFKKYKQQEEQRLREQFIKLTERQAKNMRKLNESMKDLAEEKQRLAIQMANMELELNKRKEEVLYGMSSLEIERQTFEKTKQQLQNFNAQIYNSYRLKIQEAEESKRRALQTQNQLVNKLRVVEMKAKTIEQTQDNFHEANKTDGPRTNNWISQENRGMSSDKMKQMKEDDRFKKVQEYVRQNKGSNQSHLTNSRFNLSQFMMNMDKYSKTRGTFSKV